MKFFNRVKYFMKYFINFIKENEIVVKSFIDKVLQPGRAEPSLCDRQTAMSIQFVGSNGFNNVKVRATG